MTSHERQGVWESQTNQMFDERVQANYNNNNNDNHKNNDNTTSSNSNKTITRNLKILYYWPFV